MKFRFCAALLLAALSITLFTGCAVSSAAQAPNTTSPAPAAHRPSETPTAPVLPAPTAAPAAEPASVPTVPTAAPAPETIPAPTRQASADPKLITKEEATAIALKDAGFAETEVTRLRTEFDYDNGRPEYEVDFHREGYEYDYEINAETGAILSKDIDRED